MKLTFLGTRSSEPPIGETHQRHSALLVESDSQRLMIDCGSDWQDSLAQLAPSAIILTHAHDDHAGGLSLPYPCPVHASRACWQSLKERGLPPDQTIENKELSLVLGRVAVSCFAVEHSLRAPMTGLRVSEGNASFIYLPDVAELADPRQLLFGAQLYIGDGSTFGPELTRIEEGRRCGHASIINQLVWAARSGIRQAIFTHCGAGVYTDKERAVRTLKGLAASLGLQATFAKDGMMIDFAERKG